MKLVKSENGRYSFEFLFSSKSTLSQNWKKKKTNFMVYDTEKQMLSCESPAEKFPIEW